MTQLKTGDEAPWFHLTDQNGNGWGLGDFEDQYLVLFFYEKDGSPEDTRQVEGFRDLHGEFKKLHARVLGISPDDNDSHDMFAARAKLPYNLLADTELEASKLFGVLEEDLGRPRRTTFLIGPDGAVLRVYDHVKDPASHPNEVLADLKDYFALPDEGKQKPKKK
jgi:thioredoxin-dependent peroxiredoxin